MPLRPEQARPMPKRQGRYCRAASARTLPTRMRRRGWLGADHYTRCCGAPDTLVHWHSGKGHEDVRENAAPDPGQAGGQADSGAGDAGKSAPWCPLHDRTKSAGKANRAAKSRQSRAKSPVIMLPRTCGAASCATTTPVAMPGPQSRKNRKSVFPARQCANEDRSAAGRIAASEVPTATCAAWSAEVPVSTSP